MPPPLQNFVTGGAAVPASWLNAVDILATTVLEQTATKATARTALTNDLPLEIANGGTGSRTGVSQVVSGADSGAVNAYVVAFTPNPPSVVAGTVMRFTPSNTNTGASTINGAAVIRPSGVALTGGELSSTGPALLQYTGSQWQILATAGAQPGYERTAVETTVGVIPADYTKPSHTQIGLVIVDRYQVNTTPGTTDMTVGVQNGYLVCVQPQVGLPLQFLPNSYVVSGSVPVIQITSTQQRVVIQGVHRQTRIINKGVAGLCPTIQVFGGTFWTIEGLTFSGRTGFQNMGIQVTDNGVNRSGYGTINKCIGFTNNVLCGFIDIQNANTINIENCEYWPSNVSGAEDGSATIDTTGQFAAVHIHLGSLVTFTGSVGGATSGTLTAAIPNATYTFTFANSQTRSVTVTGGTACSWAGALTAGSVLTASAGNLTGAIAGNCADIHIRNFNSSGQNTAVTFTGSVGGATSGTLTAAIPNGSYRFLFSNFDRRRVTVTGGTAVAWTGALTAGSVLTAQYSASIIIDGETNSPPPHNGFEIGNLLSERLNNISMWLTAAWFTSVRSCFLENCHVLVENNCRHVIMEALDLGATGVFRIDGTTSANNWVSLRDVAGATLNCDAANQYIDETNTVWGVSYTNNAGYITRRNVNASPVAPDIIGGQGIAFGEKATNQSLANGSTITIPAGGASMVTVFSAGNVTAIVMPAGTIPGQVIGVFNAGSYTMAFDVAATSHMFLGASSVIPPDTLVFFAWESIGGYWYTIANPNPILTQAAPAVGANQVALGNATGTTVGAAGAASALPAQPTGYLQINVAGTLQRIPYYN